MDETEIQEKVIDPEIKAETKPKKKVTEKQIKLGVFIVVVVVIVGILLWGMVPEEIYEVHQVADDTAKYLDKEISIKGVVRDWNVSSDEFLLVDEGDNITFIHANHTTAFPDGFTNNAIVVLKGDFKEVDGEYVIESYAIQIGCPSKY